MDGGGQVFHRYSPCSSEIPSLVEELISSSSGSKADDYTTRCLRACLVSTEAMNCFDVLSLDVELELCLEQSPLWLTGLKAPTN